MLVVLPLWEERAVHNGNLSGEDVKAGVKRKVLGLPKTQK
jgi:hypothetical protein